MSVQCEVIAKEEAGEVMGIFERYLTLWVSLSIIVGIALGHFLEIGRASCRERV